MLADVMELGKYILPTNQQAVAPGRRDADCNLRVRFQEVVPGFTGCLVNDMLFVGCLPQITFGTYCAIPRNYIDQRTPFLKSSYLHESVGRNDCISHGQHPCDIYNTC